MALYAFNGTWNSEKTDVLTTPDNEYHTNTNVLKFRDAYSGTNGYYTNGVGTRFGAFGRFFGGAFGVGGHDRINDALDHVRARLAAGDGTIDVVGFSRGAALALAFTNRVYKQVIDPRTREAAGDSIPRVVGRRRIVRHPDQSRAVSLPGIQPRVHADAAAERSSTATTPWRSTSGDRHFASPA